MEQKIKKNDIIDIDVKRMGINGEGIGYYEKLAVFIEQALPGETVKAKVTEVFPNRATAELIELIKPSKHRIDPFCPVYDACGGCQVQHFDYVSMLSQKRDIIVKSFDRYLKRYDRHVIKETIGMENPMHYRNKASLPLRKIDGKNRFGMYARNSNQFIAITDCGIQQPKINDIFMTITQLMDQLHIDSYDPKTNQGMISHLVVRVTEGLDEAQVSFILPKHHEDIKKLIHPLISLHPEVKSIYEVINPDMKQSFFTSQSILIYGKETVSIEMNDFKFSLKPDAFFQLNAVQADKFYHKMLELAQITKDDVVIDAYAGIAPISHYIGDKAKKIYAIEFNQDAVQSAHISLQNNDIKNVEVIGKDFLKALEELDEKRIDIMLFDPPRSGLGEKTIEVIKQFKPKRLVYGSCNPSTLAKDLNELIDLYDIKEVVPMDMFPFTSLVESITLLELKTEL